jgi:hypothetical protein
MVPLFTTSFPEKLKDPFPCHGFVSYTKQQELGNASRQDGCQEQEKSEQKHYVAR